MRRKQNSDSLACSKKGNLYVVGLVALLIVGLLFLLVVMGTQNFLQHEVNTLVQSDDDFNNVSKSVSQDFTDRNNLALDNGFALLIGGVMIGLFLAGRTLSNNPLVLGMVFILLFFTVYAGMHIVNIYEELSDDTSEDLNFSVEFPKAHAIMSNLVIVIIGGITLFGLGIYTSNNIGI